VLEDGKLRFVLGSPGGARILLTVATFSLGAEGGLNIQQAVDAPRFHTSTNRQALSRTGFTLKPLRLQARGYTLSISERHWSNGECIAVRPKTGELSAGRINAATMQAAGY